MMSETLFTGMLILFWVAELAFGSLVAYWFITQGFDSGGATADSTPTPLEDSSTTIKSLAMWGVFFAVIIAGIIIGA